MIIELKNVSKTYKGCKNPAVKDVSFQIQRGKLLTLLGPSGCGKTTILRLIAGLERPDSGEIIVRGKTVAAKKSWVPPEKRGIGMVFQDYALFPHLSVEKNIGFALKKNKRGENRKKIKEILELVDLSDYAKKQPCELSGGQQQRVALARALIMDPVVVLLDEPFSNLDVNLRDKMRRDVSRIIRKTNATAIFVTHDQKEALCLSDEIIVMNEGKIEQRGTPREIYELPETSFVASFVGNSNLLKGVIGQDKKSVITDIGKIPCFHTHNKDVGDKVFVSVRPDSFELDPEGEIKGEIQESLYKGETIDAVIKVASEKDIRLLVHIHPEIIVRRGDKVSFRVLPDFAAVIKS